MRKPEILIIIGFVVLVIGFFILAFGTVGPGEGFVFVFPFFFFGNVDALVGLALFVVFLVVFLLSIRTSSFGSMPPHQQVGTYETERYVRLTDICAFCEEAIPENATFCPSCGSPVPQRSARKDYL
ncbi:MAG: zinc-ribbon domain-containing protein [Candidatus Thorarchaeota archaeon SMTZ1-83]|nr:MAG: hypothetical protein AM324_01535 [Candidatus Thorarchaeota archaeon SMTZ1-83]